MQQMLEAVFVVEEDGLKIKREMIELHAPDQAAKLRRISAAMTSSIKEWSRN